MEVVVQASYFGVSGKYQNLNCRLAGCGTVHTQCWNDRDKPKDLYKLLKNISYTLIIELTEKHHERHQSLVQLPNNSLLHL